MSGHSQLTAANQGSIRVQAESWSNATAKEV